MSWNGMRGNVGTVPSDLTKYVVVAKENNLVKFTDEIFNYYHHAVNCINENCLVKDLEVITVYKYKQLWNKRFGIKF